MLVVPEIYEALTQRATCAPRSKIFKTPNHDIFMAVCKLAHQQALQEQHFLIATNRASGKRAIFPFTSYVWTMHGEEARELSRKFQNAWDAVSDPALFTQNIRCEVRQDEIPIIVEGLAEQHRKVISRRMADIDKDLRAVTGEDQITMLDLYTNAVAIDREHIPTHGHAVMNETWCQNGTVITDEDGEKPEQVAQAARLFMPKGTYHRPPLAVLGEMTVGKPRFSMIANGCEYG